MKYFLSACMVFVIASTHAQILARAEQPSPSKVLLSPLIVNSGQRVAYKVSRPPGLRMRNTGATLTVIGSVMLLTGVIVYTNADQNDVRTYQSGGTYYVVNDNEVYGEALIGIGAGMAVPGIIFWSKGAKKYKRYLEREAAFHIQPGRLSLSYRF